MEKRRGKRTTALLKQGYIPLDGSALSWQECRSEEAYRRVGTVSLLGYYSLKTGIFAMPEGWYLAFVLDCGEGAENAEAIQLRLYRLLVTQQRTCQLVN